MLPLISSVQASSLLHGFVWGAQVLWGFIRLVQFSWCLVDSGNTVADYSREESAWSWVSDHIIWWKLCRSDLWYHMDSVPHAIVYFPSSRVGRCSRGWFVEPPSEDFSSICKALMPFLILSLEYALIIVELLCMRKDAVSWEALKENVGFITLVRVQAVILLSYLTR